MNIAYTRVAIKNKYNEENQVERLKKYNIDEWFNEEGSGIGLDRIGLQNMIELAKEGDTIYVTSFSRLARNVNDLLMIIEQLKNKKVNLISIKEDLNLITPRGNLMLAMIKEIDEFEKENILEE